MFLWDKHGIFSKASKHEFMLTHGIFSNKYGDFEPNIEVLRPLA